MPDPPPYKELFVGRSLAGPSRSGAGSSQRAGPRWARGAVFAFPRSMERHSTEDRDPFLDLDQ